MRNNRQLNPPLVIPSSLPSQPILPPALHLSQHLGKEDDIIEHVNHSYRDISLDLIQTLSTHYGTLQDSLKNIDVPPAVTLNNMTSFIDYMKAPKAQILFSQDELLSKKTQN